MSEFVKFPKIHQFVDAIRQVKHDTDFKGVDADGNAIYAHNALYPILKYHGTVKCHGTNSGVVIDFNDNLHCQSRERIITPENDNAGFATFVYKDKEIFINLKKNICNDLNVESSDYTIVIFGEFVGKGIQKGVAISDLEKTFIIFNIILKEKMEWRGENIQSINNSIGDINVLFNIRDNKYYKQ